MSATIEQDVVVETTVDPTLQSGGRARRSRDARARKAPSTASAQGALVALDGTGAVRAMVGGRDYAKSQFNRAVDARRQPGSAFKPFVYLTAIESSGYRPDTVMIDQPVTFGNWSPENYDGKYPRRDHAEGRRWRSRSTRSPRSSPTRSAPEAVVADGEAHGHQLAARRQPVDRARHVGSLAARADRAPTLPSPTAASPCIALRHRAASRTPDGTVIFERNSLGLSRVASIESVALMNDMLQATVEMGTGRKAAIAGWPAAGKTGTSQDFRDAWFIGYTANLTAGVWVGNDSDAPTKHASAAACRRRSGESS